MMSTAKRTRATVGAHASSEQQSIAPSKPRVQREVIQRPEMEKARLDLGGTPIELANYVSTGLLGVAIGPRGNGKTNAGLLIGEQLANQGWVSVFIDPESEMEALYGKAVSSPAELAERLEKRDQSIVVVAVSGAHDFVPYGQVLLEVADKMRRATYVFIDEGQLFSAARNKAIKQATEIIDEIAERGRKRALDLFITSHRYSSQISRSMFVNKNLTLVGAQEDPLSWSALSRQFRGSGINFTDLSGLVTGEFICLSRQGIEKVRMPIAAALKKVAARSAKPKRALPTTFNQWSLALSEIPDHRLLALVDPVVEFLGVVAGLTPKQLHAGRRALQDEIEIRR